MTGKWDLKYRPTLWIKLTFFIPLLAITIYGIFFTPSSPFAMIGVFIVGYLFFGFCFRGFGGTWFIIPYVITEKDDYFWLRQFNTKEEIIKAFKENPNFFDAGFDIIFFNDSKISKKIAGDYLEHPAIQMSNYNFKDECCKCQCERFKKKSYFFYEIDKDKSRELLYKKLIERKCDWEE